MNDGILEWRAKICIILGYANRVKGYRLCYIDDCRSLKIIIRKNVTFGEYAMLNQKKKFVDRARY